MIARAHRPTPTELDCRRCGACCTPEFPSPLYVGVDAADLRRLTPAWRDRHVARGSILTKLDPVGVCVCVALRGAVGRRVSCGIYARRPGPCRRLQAGDADCRRARRQVGID